MQEDEVRLRHMLDAVMEVIEFTDGKSRRDLEKNRMLMHAVVRLFEVIGEAANGMSEEFRKKHPDIPWKLEDLPALHDCLKKIV